MKNEIVVFDAITWRLTRRKNFAASSYSSNLGTARNPRWAELKRYVWEKAYGRVPCGSVVAPIDKDPLNWVLSNLEIIKLSNSYARAVASDREKVDTRDTAVDALMTTQGFDYDEACSAYDRVERIRLCRDLI